jgi:hypothetical protein
MPVVTARRLPSDVTRIFVVGELDHDKADFLRRALLKLVGRATAREPDRDRPRGAATDQRGRRGP